MPAGRHHVVLVPGFAGFDALGQLEYYAGVTPLFQPDSDAVLHYFDNFPTAAVATRAARLLSWLNKRAARGEIKPEDEITLIGHSTGGLDIRRLIRDLDRQPARVTVDGGARVQPETVLHAIRRVVFLSVPHAGTNIADWVRSHSVWRQVVVAELRAGFAASQMPVVDRLGPAVTGAAAKLLRSGLFRAVQDSLRESDPRIGPRDGSRLADAHECASALELYLRHIASDFRAIDDLAARPPDGERVSPAHFPPQDRDRELRLWQDLGIQVRSYATVSPCPFQFEPGRPAAVWSLANPFDTAHVLEPSSATDIVYRACYRATAGGPFTPSPNLPWELEPWDNDGIVNTASMAWPLGDNVLLHADHMDIVGHYASIRGPAGAPRTRRAYDLLGSASAFDGARFRQLWTEIFAWATASRKTSAARMSLVAE
jgi:hypothetical protein